MRANQGTEQGNLLLAASLFILQLGQLRFGSQQVGFGRGFSCPPFFADREVPQRHGCHSCDESDQQCGNEEAGAGDDQIVSGDLGNLCSVAFPCSPCPWPARVCSGVTE
jgi:hypothetical protein